jgi:DNA-binding transcriptional LysR family regulator
VRRRGDERLCVIDSLVIGPPRAFAKQGRSLPFKRLADLPLVVAARPNGLRVELDQLARRVGIPLRVVVEADSLQTMKDLIVQAGLYTVLPHQAVHEEIGAATLDWSRLVKPGLPRTLSLLTSSRHPASSATRAVWREIRDIVQSPPLRSVWR